MPSSSLLRNRGLYTFSNYFTSVPEGGMLLADNCVIDRDGIVEPRRGVADYGTVGNSVSNSPQQLLVYKKRILSYLNNELYFDDNSGNFTALTTDGTTPYSFSSQSKYRVKGIETQGNFYFTTNDGIKKISVAKDADFTSVSGSIPQVTSAGGVRAPDINVTVDTGTPAGFLSALNTVAYRILWAYKDANSNLILGYPSFNTQVTNTTNNAYGVKIVAQVPPELVGSPIGSQYFCQLYRSVITATSPASDELNQVYELPYDGTSTSITILDNTPESIRDSGTPLYTNEYSGQGITQANSAPPLAQDIALYKNFTFYANTQSKQTLSFTLQGTDGFNTISGFTSISYLAGVNTLSLPAHNIPVGTTANVVLIYNNSVAPTVYTASFPTANTITLPGIDLSSYTPALVNIFTSTMDVYYGTPVQLENSIDAVVTSILVAANSLPASGILVIDSEKMSYTGGGTSHLTVVRGIDGSTAAPHTSGTYFNEFNQFYFVGRSAETSMYFSTPKAGLQQYSSFMLHSAASRQDPSVAYPKALDYVKYLFWFKLAATDVFPTANIPAATSLVTVDLTNTAVINAGDVAAFVVQALNSTGDFYATSTTTSITTSLAADISATVTSIPVNDTTLPASGTITVGSEQMTYTGGGTTTLTVVRGSNGTTPVTYPNGTLVEYIGATISIATSDSGVVDSGTASFLVNPGSLGATLTSAALNTGTDCLTTLSANADSGATYFTTVTTTITPTDTSIAVAANSFPASGMLKIDSEYMTYTGGGTTTLAVVRAVNSSYATTHAIGAGVYFVDVITVNANTFNSTGTLQVDAEQMTYTGGGTTSFVVTRGVNGTTAQTHTSGARVQYVDQISVDTNNLPTSGTILIGTEQMTYINGGTNTLTVVRAAGGTTPTTHAKGTIISYLGTAVASDWTISQTVDGTGEDIAHQFIKLSSSISAGLAIENISKSMSRVISQNVPELDLFYTSDSTALPGSMFATTTKYTSGQFSFISDLLKFSDNTNATGNMFNPVFGTSLETTSGFSKVETHLNRFYYSKVYEPESVPDLNYVDVGPQDKAILRIISLRNTLFIIKEEAIYSLTGTDSSNFYITLFDSSTLLVAPDTAQVLNNQIYMLSSQGVATVTETGVGIISRPVEDIFTRIKNSNFLHYDTASFAAAYESDRAYILFTVYNTGDTYATKAYRYNTFTQGWTSWTMSATCAVVNPATGVDKLYVGSAVDNYVLRERKNLSRTDYADKQYPLEIIEGGINGNSVRVSTVSNVAVGDMLVQTQYVTISQFNRLLIKLDIDGGFSPLTLVATYSLVPGDNLGRKLYYLTLALNGICSGISISSGSDIFATIQTEYNLLVSQLNSSGAPTIDKDYPTSSGTINQEILIDAFQYYSNTITADVVSPILTGPITLYKGIPTQIVWAPLAFGDPSLLKHIREGTFMFEYDALSSATIGYATDLSPAFETITFGLEGDGSFGHETWDGATWGGKGSSRPFRTLIPRQKQRCRFIKPQFIHSNAFYKFSIIGLSFVFEVTSTRGYK